MPSHLQLSPSLAFLLAFIALAACSSPEVEPIATRPQRTTTATTAGYPAPASPTSESGYPGPTRTRAAVPPTPGPSPTFPPSATPIPLPTALPTPQVTPVPTVAEIPDLLPTSEQSGFWIYLWRGNEISRMDSRTGEEQFLLDTMQQLGRPLADNVTYPHQEMVVGPAVVPDPTGNRLATVTVEVEGDGSRAEHFHFILSIVHLGTGQTSTIGEAIYPTWSPDGLQIAFVWGEELWVASAETGERRQLVSNPDRGQVTDIAWSPDGEQIAYMYRQGYNRIPTIWLINVDEGSEPQELVTGPRSMYGLKFAPDGHQLYFLSSTSNPRVSSTSLLSVALETGEVRQHTENMVVGGYFISPNNQWLYFDGFYVYEPTDSSPTYDLWLMNIASERLYRLTHNAGLLAAGWDTTGSHLIAQGLDLAARHDLLLISLPDLTQQPFSLPPDTHFTFTSNQPLN